MNPVRPIVAAVDFSAASPAVVGQALHAAEQTKASVRLVHIVDSAVLSQHAIALGQVPPLEEIMDHARGRLKQLLPPSASTGACEFISGRCCGRLGARARGAGRPRVPPTPPVHLKNRGATVSAPQIEPAYLHQSSRTEGSKTAGASSSTSSGSSRRGRRRACR